MKTELKEFIQKKIGKEGTKALDSVWINVLGVISSLDLDDEFVLGFLDDAKNNRIFHSFEFLNGGNWIENIREIKYQEFLQKLFQTCPKGIGTPNAACGEGELMLILSSPEIIKPKKNDIQIYGGKTINLKNDKPRVFAEIQGKKLNKILLEYLDKLGLDPNTNGGKSVQLVNPNYINKHWNPQFTKLNKNDVFGFLSVFLNNLFPDKKINQDEIREIINKSMNGSQLIWESWIQELIIFIFKYGEDKNENIVTMDVNGSVRCIPSNLEEFEDMIRRKLIIFDDNYFRMLQDNKVGIYLKFN